MKVFLLLAAAAVSLAGCGSTSTSQPGGYKERVSDSHVPTGTFIKRKRTEAGANNTGEVDKQSLENDRTMGAATINSR